MKTISKLWRQSKLKQSFCGFTVADSCFYGIFGQHLRFLFSVTICGQKIMYSAEYMEFLRHEIL